ncbi:hypothetical protein XA68_13105 [Ophiocordyceps unilateralis]|uniref:Uncharacterized protein n=1 Tax=Ophiocordyceps unilateralis TaxID=268505 RepID=A0A2A9PD62_OPHUN|nr:hypothetical protein XA68_13105 [Ophiocordyceps unilateralis]
MSAAAPKRTLDHNGDLSDGQISDYSDGPNPKRAKRLTGAHPRHHHQSAAIDPTWGQKYVFSGAADVSSIPYGEEADFEDDAEAMAYLRDVRCEANGIAHVKVAPVVEIGPQLPEELCRAHHDDMDNAVEDDGPHEPCNPCAYYEDGAYVAEPEAVQEEDDDDAVDTELREAYFSSLLARYRRLRRVLHARPPPDAASRLPSSRPTCVAPGRHASLPTVRVWPDIMRATDPLPLQLALMSKNTVLCLLRLLLDGPFLRRGRSLTERTSRWLWALLARLPDPGEMDHYGVARVRDLGRRAVLLGTSMADLAALRDQLDDANNDALAACEGGNGCDGDGDSVAVHEHGDPDDGDDRRAGHGPNVEPAADEVLQPPRDETESVEMDLSSDTEHDALQAAKTALLSRLEANSPPKTRPSAAAAAEAAQLAFNTRATLDMLLTVAGDFYGQRDLLDFRDPFG